MEPGFTRGRTAKARVMQTLLVVFELMIAVALIVVVLLQRSEGGAFGIGGGSGLGGLFSPRGAADTLTRTTAILAFFFFVICVGLNLVALRGHNEKSLLDSSAPVPSAPLLPAQKPNQGAPAPAVPSVPTPH
jgi:preprotein translocase subunit SecG